MKKILLISLILSCSFQNRLYSQNNNDAFAAALLGAAIVANSIEQHKESLEQLATDILISDYPEYSQFRLKVIGLGGGGEAWSSDGKLSFVPLALTIMENGKITDNRKLVVLLLSKGWVNDYGLDYTKISSEMWEKEDWNNFIYNYSQVNSPNNIKFLNNLVPVYKNIGSRIAKIEDIPKLPNQIILESEVLDNFKGSVNKNKNKKKTIEYRIYELEKDSVINIGLLNITKKGLVLKQGSFKGSKILYPFYDLKGDDYIIAEYSSSMKVFANENKIGLFQKSTKSSMLLNNFLVNKVHDFINGR